MSQGVPVSSALIARELRDKGYMKIISLQLQKRSIIIRLNQRSKIRDANQNKTMSTRFKPKFSIKRRQRVVITGEDKDLKKPRKVLEVILDKGRVLVEGVNIVTKHSKPTSQNTKVVSLKEAPIAISNVMLWDAKTGAPTKIKRTRENGKLVRISKNQGGNQIMSTKQILQD